MKRKVVSGLLAAVLILAVTTSAFGMFIIAPEPLPETGILFYDDNESYMAGSNYAQTTLAGGGAWTGAYGNSSLPVNINGDMMLAAVPGDKGANQRNSGLSLYSLKFKDGSGYGDVDINTGKLKIEYKLYIPSGSTIGADDLHFMYPCTYSSKGWNDSTLKEQAQLSYVTCTSDKPILGFSETEVAAYNRNPPVQIPLEFDKKYTVTMIIDYDSGTVGNYLDGELKATYKGGASIPVKQAYKFHHLYFVTTTKIASDAKPQICYDEVKIERMSDTAVLSASVNGVGENYIDVKFGDTIATEDYDVNEFFLQAISETETVHPKSIEKLGGDALRFTFADNFIPGTNYEFCINGRITAAYDNNVSLPTGTRLLFNIPTKGETVTLLDQSFDNVTFPERSNSTEFNDFYLVTDNDFALHKEYTFFYAKEGADANGGKLLRFESDGQPGNIVWIGNHQAIEFPFANGMTAANGILTVEFDASAAMKCGTAMEYTFGLSDAKDVKTVYSYEDTVTDSDVYAALVYWYGDRKILTYGQPTKSSRPFGGNDNQGDGYGQWKPIPSYQAKEVYNSDELHHYKLVIDLDGGKYDMYFDGEKIKSLNYLPGGKTEREYDAFVLSKYLFQKPGTNQVDTMLIDNIKITQEKQPAAMVNEVTFKTYDGSSYGYNRTLPAGTASAEVKFSSEMSDVDITVEGMDSSEYEVTLSGKTATVKFKNCLKANQSYAIVVGASSMSASGTPLQSDVRFSFKADAGETTYSRPVIKFNGAELTTPKNITAGGTLSAEVKVVNTAESKSGAYILLCGYQENRLLHAKLYEYTVSDTAPRIDTIKFDAPSDGFVGAEYVKAFVFDNLIDARPLARYAISE